MAKKILIKNGTLVSDEFNCQNMDLLIEGKEIIQISPVIDDSAADKIIDASNLYVAPGFVNIHGHDDFYLCEPDQSLIMKSICYQGVTTSVSGNCGISNYPLFQERRDELESYQGFLYYREKHDTWSSLSEYVSKVKGRITLNIIPLIGHGTMRVNANGFDNLLTEISLESMKKQLWDFLDQGGFGMSTGLMYMPGTFSMTSEIIDLLKSIESKENLLYSSHLRGYSDTFLESVQEAIDIAAETGMEVECSHLGPFGVQYTKELAIALKMLESARSQGLKIRFDTLAYCGGSTTIMALVPPWMYQNGLQVFLKDIEDDAFFHELITCMESYIPTWPSWEGNGWTDNFIRCLGWEHIYVLSAENKKYLGKNFITIGQEMQITTHEAFRKVLSDEAGSAVMLMAGVGTCLDEQSGDMSSFDSMVEHPLSSIGIDAIFKEGGRTMPYAFGSFPKIIDRYVKTRKSLSLQAAVRKFTVDVLGRFNIHNRGVLKEGAFADLVIFDLNSMKDYPDFYADSPLLATGVKYLFINGGLVIEDAVFDETAVSGEVLLNS